MIGQQRYFSGAELRPVVEALKPVLTQFPLEQSLTAMLAMIIILQKPDIALNALTELVLSASQHIALNLDNLENPVDASKLN